jgi:hypothetical protein
MPPTLALPRAIRVVNFTVRYAISSSSLEPYLMLMMLVLRDKTDPSAHVTITWRTDIVGATKILSTINSFRLFRSRIDVIITNPVSLGRTYIVDPDDSTEFSLASADFLSNREKRSITFEQGPSFSN